MSSVTPLPSGVVFMDGAMGTSLRERGVPDHVPPCLVCVDSPARVRSVHESFHHAGARVLLTNTFVATRGHLAAVGRGADVTPVIHAATSLARSTSAGTPVSIAGDLGPAQARTEYREALEAFATAPYPIDLLILETFSDPDDLLAALEARDDILPQVPLLVSVFGQPDRPDRLAALVSALDGRTGIAAVGLNCWSTPEGFLKGFSALKDLHPGPWLARPSMPAEGEGAWLQLTHELLSVGATWIGGCCGVNPAALAKLGSHPHFRPSWEA